MNAKAEKKIGAQDRYLCFSLGKEEYALPLSHVKEVISVPEITQVPFAPKYFLGIVNIRGQVISVMDLRHKIGLTETKIGAETAMIIADLSNVLLGFVVDSVDRVMALTKAEISETPEFLTVANSVHIIGIVKKNDRLVMLLDIAKTLGADSLNIINKMVS